MVTLAILAGLPGSGKSTLARRLKAERGFFVVSSDGLRLALNAGVYPRVVTGDYATLEPLVGELWRLAARRFLEAGHDVAVDGTHLTRARRAAWREFARQVAPGARVEIHWCVGRHDSPARWATERGHAPEEHRTIRAELEATVEEPTADEADLIAVHDSGGG